MTTSLKSIMAVGIVLGGVALPTQAQALSIPGGDKLALWMAGAMANTITTRVTSGQVISKEEMCKKGNLIGLKDLYRVRSVEGAQKVLKGSISLRAGAGVLAKGSNTISALGLLACTGVADFDQSDFAKIAKKKLPDTSEAALKKVVELGVLRGARATTALTCAAVGAGLVATEVGLSAIPHIATACGTTITTLQAAIAKKKK